MYATDKFIFIHLMRTGGSSCIEKMNGIDVGYHQPRRCMPEKYQHLPIIGNVRDPFEWYVSLYKHSRRQQRMPQVLNCILDYKDYSFKDSIKMLNDTSWMTDDDKKRALANFPDEYDWNDSCQNLIKSDFISYLESDDGFLTWLFKHMYSVDGGSVDDVHYCRLEQLDSDWIEFIGYPMNKFQKINATDVEFDVEFDDELKSLIKKKDKFYIDKFYKESM